MAQLDGDLDNLAKVRSRGCLARWIVEVSIALELLLDEILHSLQVIIVEGLAKQVQHQKGLLVGYRAELEGSHHVKHRFDNSLAHDGAQDARLSDWALFGHQSDKTT